MIITNLLDQAVFYNDIECKICAIYQKDNCICFGLMDNKGQLFFDIPPSSVTINEQKYTAFIFYNPDKKISIIKTIRELVSVGLAEAKYYVENGGSIIKIKNNLTYVEAEEMLKHIERNGHEGKITKEKP